ncbi:MAG: ferritin, partial [Duncaniella sp.]|nr:ferritin [Duncaniella sp.]
MLKPNVQSALNEQVNAELFSSYLYLSMSLHFEAEGLKGISNWFYIQWQEEQAHARIFMNYINARGGRVELKAIDAVPTSWTDPTDAFKATLEHEQKVTALINSLYTLASKEEDYATRDRLAWFVTEQVEEEETATTISNARKILNERNPHKGAYKLGIESFKIVYRFQMRCLENYHRSMALALFTLEGDGATEAATDAFG